MDIFEQLQIPFDEDLHCYFEKNTLIAKYLSKECDIDIQDEEGRTGIFMLYGNYNEHICRLLLRCKPNVNIPTYDGMYPIHMASRFCTATALGELIKFGAGVNVKDKFERSPLHDAVYYNSLEVIQLLIKEGCRINDIDSEGNGLLHLCAMRNDFKATEILEFLIKQDIDTNVSNMYGKTSLHYAARKTGNLKVLLGTSKAIINQTDKDGKTALHYACTYAHYHDRVKVLLDNGSDPHICDKYGRNSLMYICKDGPVQTLKMLLPCIEGTINMQDNLRNTALHYASMRTNISHHAIHLVAAGADTDIQNGQGKTPLMLAIEIHRSDTIELLLDKTSNPNIQDDMGRSALHYILLHHTNYKVEDDGRTGASEAGTVLSSTERFITDLLEKGANINLMDVNSMTPLHYACSCTRDLDIVKLLLSRQADVYAKDCDGKLPIHVAVENNEMDIVLHLIDVSTPTYFLPYRIQSTDTASFVPASRDYPLEESVLVAAAKYSSLECFKVLWKGIVLRRFTNISPRLVLRELCIRKDLELIQYVFRNRNIDINTTYQDGCTFLHYAARYCDLEVIQWLVDFGANLFAEDEAKALPIHIACKYSTKNVIEWFKEKIIHGEIRQATTKGEALLYHKDNEKRGLLHYAAQNKDMDVIALFLDVGIDINCRDKRCKTAMHYGSKHFTTNIVKNLMKNGVDINPCDNKGRTPLHLAAQEGNLSFLKCLIENGGDTDLLDDSGQTALMLARSKMQFEAVKLLKEYTKRVNKPTDADSWSMVDNKKRSLLHLECKNSNFRGVCDLLQSNSGKQLIDNIDIDGKCALHYASEKGNQQITYILSIFGADLEIKDRFGKTPLQVAVESWNISTVTLLLHHGASVDVKDKDLRTPLHYSVIANMKEMTGVLIAHGASVDIVDGQNKTPIEYAQDKDILSILKQDGKTSSYSPNETECGKFEMVYENICILEMESVRLSSDEYIFRPSTKGYTTLHHIEQVILKESLFCINFLVNLKDDSDVTEDYGTLVKYAVLFLTANLPWGYLKHHITSHCHNLKTILQNIAEKHEMSSVNVSRLLQEIHEAKKQRSQSSVTPVFSTTEKVRHAASLIEKCEENTQAKTKMVHSTINRRGLSSSLLKFVQQELHPHSNKRDKPTIEAMQSDIQKGVVRGKWDEVSKLMVKGRDINVQDVNGWSVLHYCILHDLKEFAMMFIRHGVDVNQVTNDVSPFSLMHCKYSYDSEKKICTTLSPLLLSTLLNRVTFAKCLAEDVTLDSRQFQICLKLALGTQIEEMLMQGLCKHLTRKYSSLSLEAFPAYLQTSPLERVIVGLSKKVFKTTKLDLLSVKVILRNPDFFDDNDSVGEN